MGRAPNRFRVRDYTSGSRWATPNEPTSEGRVVVQDLDYQDDRALEGDSRNWSWRDRGRDGHGEPADLDGPRPGWRSRWQTIATAFSAALIAIVLLKPWAGGPFAGNGQPPSDPAPSAGPTEDVAAATYEAINLNLVDWSALATPDPDTGWGVASATLALPPGATDGSQGVTTTASWAASGPDPSASEMAVTIPVLPGRHVFALAITWPANVTADSVVFTYDSPDSTQPGESAPASFRPQTELYVVPASQATSADPVVVSGSAPPEPLTSGDFWVAPVDWISLPSPGLQAELWRSGPWWWPTGQYRVTVSSGTGLRTMVIRLAGQP
jgi:hypothetical protein